MWYAFFRSAALLKKFQLRGTSFISETYFLLLISFGIMIVGINLLVVYGESDWLYYL